MPDEIVRIISIKGEYSPLDRLEKGTPVAKGREAVAQSSLKPLVQAVLYIYFDGFDEAHDIAQNHEGTAAGNWIHAIVHRREPDTSNSKYWYHRVKWPPQVKEAIAQEVLLLGQKEWEPTAFVDQCEKFRKKDPNDKTYQALAKVQQIEWRALLNYVIGLEN